MSDFCKNEWNLVEMSENAKEQIVKYIVKEESVTCLLCDMISMKCETVSRTEFFLRAKQRNTNIQLEDDKILELITKSRASEYKLEENQLSVKYYVSGYPYRFTWHLSRSSTVEFMEFFTAPLLCTLKSSQEKIEELEELLKKKDEEIADYKLSGATLVRKHLETTPFDPQTLPRAHDFSFVNTHNFAKIYNLCGISKIPDLVFNESPKISKNVSSPGTSPSTSKISPIRRSRIMNNLKRSKDEKLLYDDEANSQEIVSNDNVVIVEAETPPANPKIRKRLNL